MRVLDDLFRRVERQHRCPLWQAFLGVVHPGEASGASEYEIYFNFALLYHADKVRIRQLQLHDRGKLSIEPSADLVAVHWHMSVDEERKKR